MKLVRYTFEHARSRESQGNFLRAFFEAADLSLDDEYVDLCDMDRQVSLRNSINNFADYLFENFFLPRMSAPKMLISLQTRSIPINLFFYSLVVKASTRKTPQPSPASHSAVQRAQGAEGQAFLGTTERLSALRGLCLARDRHRCVISRCFDEPEAVERDNNARRQGGMPCDDDGASLNGELFELLEVAHILPHSLTRVNANKQLVSS